MSSRDFYIKILNIRIPLESYPGIIITYIFNGYVKAFYSDPIYYPSVEENSNVILNSSMEILAGAEGFSSIFLFNF